MVMQIEGLLESKLHLTVKGVRESVLDTLR